MSTRPPLTTSIPFWGLLVVSLATIGGGWYLTTDKLGAMTKTLTDGTATVAEVYVGQSLAVLGAILIGAGVVGVLLALSVAALSTLRPHSVEVVEPIDWDAADESYAVPGEVYVPPTATVEPEAAAEAATVAPVATEEPRADDEPEASASR